MIFSLIFLYNSFAQQAPLPVTWASFSLTTNLLSFTYPSYSAEASYNITYYNGSTANYLPSTTQTTASIFCPQIDGTPLTITYTATVSSVTSPYAPNITLVCAGYPSAITALTYTSFLKAVTIAWSAPSANGIPLQGYRIKKLNTATSVWSVTGMVSATELTYTEDIVYGTSYTYGVFAYNQVGEALSSFNLVVKVAQAASYVTSTATVPSVVKAGYVTEFKVNLIDAGGNKVINPSVMILEIRDACAIGTGYDCVRVSSDDPLYVKDLINGFTYYTMTDNKDGTMSAFVNVPLAGPYTFSIIQLQNQGVLVDIWDNIWNLTPLDQTYTLPTINITWPAFTLISKFSSEYISAKFYTFLLAPLTDTYTFYVTANDYFSFYVNGVLKLSSFEICCQENWVSVDLTANTYYFIQINFVQLDSDAWVQLRWSSRSFPKQILSTSSLYWPARISGSPWTQVVSIGLSDPSSCYFTGASTIVSGIIYPFTLYSVNHKGEIIDNPNDVFSLEFDGPSSYYFTSTYKGNGVSTVSVILGVVGNYNAAIKLYGSDIKGSNYNVVVTSGFASVVHTYVEVLETVTAGVVNKMPVHLKDGFGNDCSNGEVIMSLIYLDSDDYISPISAISANQTFFGINRSGSMIGSLLVFTVFVAGNYNVTIYLNHIVLTDYILHVVPGNVFAPACVAVYPTSSVIAGEVYSFFIQARDLYYNNLIVSELPFQVLTASGPEAVSGETSVAAGVITAFLTATIAGSYLPELKIDGFSVVGLSSFTVTYASFSDELSRVKVTSTQSSGVYTEAFIYTVDIYGNTRGGGDVLTFSITGQSSLPGILTDLNNGTYVLGFTPYLVDTYVISVYHNDKLIGESVSITVTNSNIRGLYTKFNAYTAQVAGKGLLSIISADIGNNQIQNPVNSVFISNQYYYLLLQGPQNASIPSSFTDFSAYQFSLASITTSGTYLISAALMEESGLTSFYFRDNSFQGLYSSLNYNNFPNTPPNFYTSKDPTINFTYTSTPYPDFFSAYWTGLLLPPTSDTYSFVLQSDNKVRLTVNGYVIIDSISGNVQTGSLLLTGGRFYSVKIEYLNGGNQGFLRLLWSTKTQSLQVVPTTALYSEVLNSACPCQLLVVPDATNALSCTVVQYPGDLDPVNRAYVRIAKTFQIVAMDKYLNKAITTSDTFSATFATGVAPAAVTITSDSPGLYKGTFTPVAAGTFNLRVSLTVAGSLVNFANVLINVLAGPTDPTKTTFLNLQTSIVAGNETSFFIIVRDSSSTQQIKGGDNIVLNVFNTSVLPSSQISILDNDDGSYSVNLIIYKTGNYSVQVYINAVLASTRFINVTCANMSLTNSLISVPTPGTFGSNISSEIYIRDLYSNPYYFLVPVFVYMTKENNPNFRPLRFNITTVDLRAGFYRANATFSLALVDISGECTLTDPRSICNFVESLTVYSGVFEPRLQATYYDTPDTLGVPVTIQKDSLINFAWNDTVNGIDIESLGVVWQGFIRPSATKTYALSLVSDDWAEVFIGGVSVMSTQSNTTSIAMSSTTYHILRVNYNNTVGNGAVILQWADTAVVPIPATVLFSTMNSTAISGSLLNYEATQTATS